MSLNHNRIKVADLEKNQPNKILTTNNIGELEFNDIYNSLDCLVEGKALDARQGKVLKDLIDNLNSLLTSDNIDLNTIQELVDAVEILRNSLNSILVNDLGTGGSAKALTAEMGKTLKGLIDALTTVVASKQASLVSGTNIKTVNGNSILGIGDLIISSGVTRTLKTITSANLSKQDASGFVAYINSLNTPLVVAANELVEYQLSDTGRMFKLLLNGRSFGVGQPAITTANVEDVALWMQKDITLSNYPSTRNDGQSATNKVLAPDLNGKLGLFSIATAPAPYMELLIPDSTLPSTTTNFTIKGAFFTPTMTVAIVGQTINYITFVSDNLIKVNVTTSASEGSYAVTLNNGLSATFPNTVLIVLGTIYKPTDSDWTSKSTIDTSTVSAAKMLAIDVQGSAMLSTSFWKMTSGVGKRFSWKWTESPFEPNPVNGGTNYGVTLYRLDGTPVYQLNTYGTNKLNGWWLGVRDFITGSNNYNFERIESYSIGLSRNYMFERTAAGLITLKRDNITIWTPMYQETGDLKIGVLVRELDIDNIKCIDLA